MPRTKPELPQAGLGWEVISGGASGRHPFFGHVSGDCIPLGFSGKARSREAAIYTPRGPPLNPVFFLSLVVTKNYSPGAVPY